jgi:hypothetical protein
VAVPPLRSSGATGEFAPAGANWRNPVFGHDPVLTQDHVKRGGMDVHFRPNSQRLTSSSRFLCN